MCDALVPSFGSFYPVSPLLLSSLLMMWHSCYAMIINRRYTHTCISLVNIVCQFSQVFIRSAFPWCSEKSMFFFQSHDWLHGWFYFNKMNKSSSVCISWYLTSQNEVSFTLNYTLGQRANKIHYVMSSLAEVYSSSFHQMMICTKITWNNVLESIFFVENF